ncbi:ABC transporter substrate-binding protein [Romboutsia weinsteinii]|uniref:ABC transporter substrate-binding protein n=1 Tax=Romboutsia weinsteinii TaxID=2020949 RepID=A0A371J110_9FIRM|nr:ABC transporter substrate-binding protein [Romboutsia weinsteinii]RDY26367.1 ABC transporter substrate-binding protein [Romboutsia weinsteinii]
MNKKIMALLLTGVISATALVGCGKSGDSASSNKLIVSTWGLNEDVLKETVFEPFAKEHGVEIVLEVGNNSERLTKMKNNPNSNIDITYLAESFAEQGIEAGIFEKLDYSKIPNAENINEKAKHTVEAGYGPAYTQNSIGIVVDPLAGIEINSWEDLWKPELKGKIAIPDITTTNGAAIVSIAAEKAGVDLNSDKGEAAFKQLESLKPNVVKTYSKSSDLANMFSSGEIVAAVASDFAFETIAKAKPEVKNVIPASGTYLNFNTININKNSKNKELAYEFINYALSPEVQERAAKALNEAPVNTGVKLNEEDSKNLAYGPIVENAKTVDFKFVNTLMNDWINTWNRIMN